MFDTEEVSNEPSGASHHFRLIHLNVNNPLGLLPGHSTNRVMAIRLTPGMLLAGMGLALHAPALFGQSPQPVSDRFGHMGIGTVQPDRSAILDLTALDAGFLLPRTSPGSILNPAKGLMIFEPSTNLIRLNTGTSLVPFWDTVLTAGSNIAWLTYGNAGTDGGVTDFLGTNDNQAFEIHVNQSGYLMTPTTGNGRVVRYEPNATSPNIIGGYNGNSVGVGAVGATIGGGGQNGQINIIGGMAGGTIGGGMGNTVSAINGTISGGSGNSAVGSNAVIGGGSGNSTVGNSATVSGGQNNSVTAANGTIGGGVNHGVAGVSGTIGGGNSNSVAGVGGTVGGGSSNSAAGFLATVGGGRGNVATGDSATISGGGGNNVTATGDGGAIGGGHSNSVAGLFGTIGGGYVNSTTGPLATIGGGQGNSVTEINGTIGGGQNNSVTAGDGTIGGGENNTVGRHNATIGGGYGNTIGTLGASATIGGGENNSVTESYGTIGGGTANSVAGNYGTIGGGQNNSATAAANFGVIGGGQNNTMSAPFSAIGGGSGNSIVGGYSTIPGGNNLTIGATSLGFSGDQGIQTTDVSAFADIAYFGNVNLWLGNVDGTARELRFYEPNADPGDQSHLTYTNTGTGSDYTAFMAQAQPGGSITYTLPAANGTDGQMLTIAALPAPTAGTATLRWAGPEEFAWALDGNVLTGGSPSTPTEFLGSNNAYDLVFRTDGTERMRIDAIGLVGVGGGATNSRVEAIVPDATLNGVQGIIGPVAGSSTGNALYGYSSHTSGRAGLFEISNPGNTDNAVDVLTGGLGHALQVGTTGAGSAGVFTITNPASTSIAMDIRNDGTGNALSSIATGTAGAAYFAIQNSASSANALEVTTDGTGSAGSFTVTEPTSVSPALVATSAGIGPAGIFQTTDPSNSGPTLFATTMGTGPAGFFSVAGTNAAGVMSLVDGTLPALVATNTNASVGSAGIFSVNDPTPVPTNVADVLTASTNALGRAGYFEINNGNNSSNVVEAITIGSGYAGSFTATNIGSGGGGNGVYAQSDVGGIGLNVAAGRVFMPFGSVADGGTVASDLAIVRIDDNMAAVSVPVITLPSVGVANGQILYVYNDDPDGAVVNGVIVGNGDFAAAQLGVRVYIYGATTVGTGGWIAMP